MKRLLSIYYLTFVGLLLTIIIVGCGGDDDKNDISNGTYDLTYRGETNMKYVEWETSEITPWLHLKLNFSEGIPKGSEWKLYCDESWIKLRNTRGKVNDRYEKIPFTIENNTNYEDREASIYLDVDNGIPTSSKEATVIIHQYGYETHLDWGKTISFTTNRSISESSELSITSLKVYQLMDVDWGDGNKDVLTRSDYYSSKSNLSITHEYKTNKTYTVKLRFAPEDLKTLHTYFSFEVSNNQGLEEVSYYSEGTQSVISIDNTQNVFITYSDNSGFKVKQY